MLELNNEGTTQPARNQQAGFSLIEGLLILVIVGIIGFVGWYVVNTRQINEQTVNDSQNALLSTKEFSDKTDFYSFSYPSDWFLEKQLTLKKGAPESVVVRFPDGPEAPFPVYVTADNTPATSLAMIKAWQAGAKSEPFEKVTISGYEALHRHIEETDFIEDAYLIMNKDKSSVTYLITSKNLLSGASKFDATDKNEEFEAIVNSTKFLEP